MYVNFAKILIVFGILLILLGGLTLLFGKIGIFGRLPGDIHVQKKNFEFHLPIATCIIASILLSILLSVIFKWFRK